MSEDKFHHHRHLQAIADADVRWILERDTHYGASWKSEGGIGAWANVKRKIDRMLVLMARPKPPASFSVKNVDEALEGPTLQNAGMVTLPWNGAPGTLEEHVRHLRDCYVAGNAFAAIRQDPEGKDGSFLGQLRDLRHYLLLIEAEMVAREVVFAPVSELRPDVTAQELGVNQEPSEAECPRFMLTTADPRSLELSAYSLRPGDHVLVENRSDQTLKIVPASADVRNFSVGAERAAPEAGAQHASLTPWAVSDQWRHRHGLQRGGPNEDVFDTWYRQVAPGTYVLEPVMEGYVPTLHQGIPDVIAGCYRSFSGGLILLVENVPPDARDWFPKLRREQNAKEHANLPYWLQVLYEWNEPENKFKIIAGNEAWTGEE